MIYGVRDAGGSSRLWSTEGCDLHFVLILVTRLRYLPVGDDFPLYPSYDVGSIAVI